MTPEEKLRMSLEERVASVRKELEALEAWLKEQPDFKRQYEELVAATENKLNAAEVESKELKRKLEALEADVNTLTRLNLELTERVNQLGAEKEAAEKKLSEANASRTALGVLVGPVVTEALGAQLKEIVQGLLLDRIEPMSKEISARVMEGEVPQELAHRVVEILSTQEVKLTRVLGDFTLQVDRTPLTAEQATMRGKFMRMLLDGFCDNPTTVPKMVTWLNSQFPLSKTDRTKTEAEANYFTEQEILRHDIRSDGTHFYNLRPRAKERLHLVEKEAKG